MGFTVGIDVGGTKIAGGVVDERGQVLTTARRESPATDTEAIEQTIEDLVAELRASHEVDAVGVAAAGFIDVTRSTVLFAPNLAWRDEPLRADLERRIDIPVVIENDANAAAWGEFTFGAGEDVDDFVLVTLGTGVGGGIVLNGELLRGRFGVAAELGHMRVVPDGLECGCGNCGCWEQYASGTALVRRARSLADEGAPGAQVLVSHAGGEVSDIDGPLITSTAQDGDPFAVGLMESLGRWVGEGVASLAAVLDPAVVVIGGGVAEAGDLLLGPAREVFDSRLIGRGHRPSLEMRTAVLGNKAGMIGAADLARRP
ncbi:MAG TPA: ROK family glucokinase [Nocardioidaceae bacterium]|nr:ROK family glucokinase [Nocardioidaceae bacterium]